MHANGIDYYYEIHGSGEPLLLLHGGLGSIDMFGPVLPALAKTRQVIAVDLHGHGRTTLGDRPIDLIDIANDLAVVRGALGYRQVDVGLLGGGLKDAGCQREHISPNRFAIIPDVTHYELFLSPEFARTILPFLDGKGGAKRSADQVNDPSGGTLR